MQLHLKDVVSEQRGELYQARGRYRCVLSSCILMRCYTEFMRLKLRLVVVV